MDSFYEALRGIGYTHPVHPTMIYLPVGTVIAAFFFGLLALFLRRSSVAVSAKHCIILAFIAVFPAILFGYMDWQYYHGGNWMFPIKVKMALAALLVILLTAALLLHWKMEPTSKVFLPIYSLAFLTVVALGYFGGEIVFGMPSTRGAAQPSVEETGVGKPDGTVTFAQISEIFSQHCTMCHKGSDAPEGLQLETYDQVMSGGEHGPVIVPGEPGKSELVLRITGESMPRMPFRQPPLPEDKIETISRWVQQGAHNGK